ncbi:hypothetical protein [Planobispora longispora]|uniref:Uncharacterized protein n=1 Tax=Planobispora longispora TaxID=28887 RepID=A0A8J3RT14_9ACTN|nr:hypothetical protein [Planobispora longispora]GIH79656.1 hypothetical protein Plo01_60850 [Planobispora longispora]
MHDAPLFEALLIGGRSGVDIARDVIAATGWSTEKPRPSDDDLDE